MKKQLLLFILALLPMLAMADYSGKCGDNVTYYYSSSTQTLTIQGTGAMYDYSSSSPAPWDSYKGDIITIVIVDGVTSIGDYAFSYDCSGLSSVTIGNSVTSIGQYAFYSCSKLTSITIPNSVTSIGFQAFSFCSKLTSITIPNSVTSIGGYAFYGTAWYNNQPDGLIYAGKVAYKYKGTMPENTSITIKDGTCSITGSAFDGCSGLTSIEIPNSVTSIGNYAFSGCSGLTSVTFPNSVTSIGYHAFYNCSGLKKVIVPDFDIAAWCGIEFGSVAANPLHYARHLYSDDDTEITVLAIPDGVASIGNWAFWGCSSLTSITIPSSVTSIGEYAFESCSGLTLVECNIGKAFNISSNTFSSDTYNNAELRVPRDLSSMYKQATGWKNFKSITEGNVGVCGNNLTYTYSEASGKLTIQGTGAMYDYSSSSPAPWNSYKGDIITIVIEDGATSVGSYAFSGCNSLYSVTFGKDVKTVGSDAFFGCSGLQKVIAPDIAAWCGINFGNEYANPLYYVHHLYSDKSTEITELVIPDGVTSIGDRAFYKCSGLTSVTIPNSVTSIGEYAFNGCSGLQKVIVPDIAAWCGIEFGNETANPLYNVHHLYSDDNTEITELVIPDGVTSIGNYAFSGCSKLASVTIGSGVTSIGYSAFRYCFGITSVTIGTGVTSIGSYAFMDSMKLASVTFHCNNVGTWFSGKSSIKEVWIEKEVTSIAQQSFAGCSGLQSVYNNAEDAFTIAKNTFDDATYSSATLYVPTGMKATYEDTPWWLSFNKMEEYDFPTGITIPQQSKDVKVVDAYQINGLKTGSMQKGLNILRMSDGTTIKVVK